LANLWYFIVSFKSNMNHSPLNSGLTLAETIREIGSERAVVAIDMANVQFWDASGGKIPAGSEIVEKLSFTKLAEYLKKIEAVKKRYLFAAKYSFNPIFIERVINLIGGINPAFLERARVDVKNDETYEYKGVNYDLELLMIVANELMAARKINEIRHNILRQLKHVTMQIISNKNLKKREKQGYEVVTTEYRVYKNTVAKMRLIGNLARAQEIVDIRESGSFNDVEVEVSYPEEQGVEPLKRNVEGLMKTLDELKSGIKEHCKVIDSLKEIINQVENLSGELKRRDNDIKSLERIYDKTRYKLREIEMIADNSVNTLVSKGNVDSFLVAEMMDAKVMDSADTFVVFSGDGDFRKMYEKMLDREKKVVVVSPADYLNSGLERMIEEGQISLVDPHQDEQIWKKVKVPKSVR
jgi:uncharacterized LabA/DUF88 family protein